MRLVWVLCTACLKSKVFCKKNESHVSAALRGVNVWIVLFRRRADHTYTYVVVEAARRAKQPWLCARRVLDHHRVQPTRVFLKNGGLGRILGCAREDWFLPGLSGCVTHRNVR